MVQLLQRFVALTVVRMCHVQHLDRICVCRIHQAWVNPMQVPVRVRAQRTCKKVILLGRIRTSAVAQSIPEPALSRDLTRALTWRLRRGWRSYSPIRNQSRITTSNGYTGEKLTNPSGIPTLAPPTFVNDSISTPVSESDERATVGQSISLHILLKGLYTADVATPFEEMDFSISVSKMARCLLRTASTSSRVIIPSFCDEKKNAAIRTGGNYGNYDNQRTISLSSYNSGTLFLVRILRYINGWVNAGSSSSLCPLCACRSVIAGAITKEIRTNDDRQVNQRWCPAIEPFQQREVSDICVTLPSWTRFCT